MKQDVWKPTTAEAIHVLKILFGQKTLVNEEA